MNTSKGAILNRVFLAQLAGTAVFDPNGDQLGKVRNAVATLRTNNQPPRMLGFIIASLRSAIGEVTTRDYLRSEITDAIEEIVKNLNKKS
jgi:uncharacterized sodium:solute symporter family permease YidK